MKTFNANLLLLTLFLVAHVSNAQDNTNNYNFKDFDKVQIENVSGTIEIELGKSFAIVISGNDNAVEQVQITQAADKLLFKLDKKFLSDWQNRKVIKMKIMMPEISKLYNNSNADVEIKSFIGRYIGIQNNGNGNVSLLGSLVDFIEITNNGNGNVETKTVTAKKVELSKTGNGDISVNTDQDFKVDMSGNGDVVNYGKGKAVIINQTGNGKVVYRN